MKDFLYNLLIWASALVVLIGIVGFFATIYINFPLAFWAMIFLIVFVAALTFLLAEIGDRL